MSHVGAAGSWNTLAPDRVRLARAHTRPAPCLFLFFLPLSSPYRPKGGGKQEELEVGLSQWADGPRARPPPSLRRGPIEIYYNVVANGGGGARAGGRAAGRAGLAWQREGGRARARAARLLARSLARSLPPLVGLVSQQQPAGPRAAEGPSLGRRRLLLPLFVGLQQWRAQEPGPGATGEARRQRRRGSRGGGRGAVPVGTVLAAAAALQPLCLQHPTGPGPGRGLSRGGTSCAHWDASRDASRDAARGARGGPEPLRKGKGLRRGSVGKLGLGCIFDEGKSVPSGASITVRCAGASGENQMRRIAGFRR